jgi:hypothetical protein
MYGGAEPIFFANSSVFSGSVRSCVINMHNESPPINLRVEQKKLCENINRVVLSIKCIGFWKRIESMKSQWIPCNGHHRFWVVCFDPSGGSSSAQSHIC